MFFKLIQNIRQKSHKGRIKKLRDGSVLESTCCCFRWSLFGSQYYGSRGSDVFWHLWALHTCCPQTYMQANCSHMSYKNSKKKKKMCKVSCNRTETSIDWWWWEMDKRQMTEWTALKGQKSTATEIGNSMRFQTNRQECCTEGKTIWINVWTERHSGNEQRLTAWEARQKILKKEEALWRDIWHGLK